MTRGASLERLFVGANRYLDICKEHELIEVPDLIPEEDTVLHGISLDET